MVFRSGMHRSVRSIVGKEQEPRLYVIARLAMQLQPAECLIGKEISEVRAGEFRQRLTIAFE